MSTTTQTVESIQLKHRHVAGGRPEAEEVGEILLNDPLSLETKKVKQDFIQNDLKGRKKLQNFYNNQNDMIDTMLSALDETDKEEEQKQALKVSK
jgi:flavin-dependent dehydrogenase